MAYPTVAVANAFIKKALDGKLGDLTPMKLQKLMFFAQSWHLKLYDEPLIDDFFAKWQYGPVIPSLYHEVKRYGGGEIKKTISSIVDCDDEVTIVTPVVPKTDRRTSMFIDKIISVYGPLRGTQLSYLTHQKGTAWSCTEKDSSVIDNKLLKECIE
ncbi:Panacea domain-containing protein [Lonsdalea britannica]|uniref:Panacea domain-containing protein n=1 Tax=Lonsdalea britannica TaxID=1082704 RepID=UPI0026F20A28|nr:type II toxin-antitoxin system antitoxin SocA domain-containing protein [Lonsdalea britannica]